MNSFELLAQLWQKCFLKFIGSVNSVIATAELELFKEGSGQLDLNWDSTISIREIRDHITSLADRIGREQATCDVLTSALTLIQRTNNNSVPLKQEDVAEQQPEQDFSTRAASVQELFLRLRQLDAQAVRVATDPSAEVVIQMQASTNPREREDKAALPLFLCADDDFMDRRPHFKTFVKLIDNYEMWRSAGDTDTKEEQGEIDEFLDEVMRSPMMKELMLFVGESDADEMRAELKRIWFEPVQEGRNGFEHVFLMEYAKGKISGGHCWVSFYHYEKRGVVNFHGIIAKTKNMLTLQYRSKADSGQTLYKPIGGFWIGNSPVADFVIASMFVITRHNVIRDEEGNNYQIRTFLDSQGRVLAHYPVLVDN